MSLNKKRKNIIIGSVIASVISIGTIVGVSVQVLSKKSDPGRKQIPKRENQNAIVNLNGVSYLNNNTNKELKIGDMIELKLDIPNGKKVSEIRINNQKQSIQLSEQNTFNWVINEQNTNIEVIYSDFQNFKVEFSNNISLTTPNVNLSNVKEETLLEFSFQIPEGKDINSLTINDEEYKSHISNNSFSYKINSNTTINLTFKDKESNVFVEQNNNDKDGQSNNNDKEVSNEVPRDSNNDRTDSGEPKNPENSNQKNEIVKEIPEEKNKNSTLNLQGFLEESKIVEQGKVVTLNLKIPTNNHLVSLTVDGVDKKDQVINGQFSFTPEKDTYQVNATYSLNTYSLTLENSELSIENNANKASIDYNSEVIVSINVPDGKKIQELMVNGSNKRREVDSNNKFRFNIKNNTTVSVKFKDTVHQVKNYPLTLGSNLVTSSHINLQSVPENSTIRVFFDIPSGQEISTLTVNNQNKLSSIDESKAFIDLTMDEAKNVQVTFKNRSNANKTVYVGTNNRNYTDFGVYIYKSSQIFKDNNNNSPIFGAKAGDLILLKIIFENEQKSIDKLILDTLQGRKIELQSNIVGDLAFVKVVDASVNDINVTFKEKPKKIVDKSKLLEAIRLAEEKKKSSAYIFEKDGEIKRVFDDSLKDSINIKDKENATEEEVNVSAEKLIDSMDNLNGQYNKKSFDFKDIKNVELFNVDNGIQKVAGLSGENFDYNKYFAKITNGEEIFNLPIRNITRVNNKYEVTINNDRLVYFNSSNDAIDHFSFYVDQISTEQGAITSFSQLVSEITKNPSGTFKIGSDLYASNTNEDAYIMNEFTGTLTSSENKSYTIYGLNKPLFNQLTNATLENFKIKNSTLELTKNGGVISIAATSSNIRRLEIEATVNYRRSQTDTTYVGGIFGSLSGGTGTNDKKIEKNIFNVNLNIFNGSTNGQYYGIVASRSYNIDLTKNYILGNITSDQNLQNKVGLVIGNNSNKLTTMNENIINVHNSITSNIMGNENSETIENNYIVTESTTDETHISKRELNQKLLNLEIIKNEAKLNVFDKVNYASVNNYDSTRIIAYKNMSKLVPLYDRNTIVELGNLVSTSDILYTKEINSVITLTKDDIFATNLYNKDLIKKVLVKFNDNTIQVYELSSPVQFDNTNIYEYTFNDNLKFTPRQFLNKNQQLIDELAQEFNSLTLNSTEFQNLVGLNEYNDKFRSNIRDEKMKQSWPGETMDALYLNKTFDYVKEHIKDYLESIIANYNIADYSNDTIKKLIKKEITDNKLKIMLALTYLERLYKVQFGKYNIKNIVLFIPDFYNAKIKNIDLLKEIGSLKFEDLLLQNNDKVFKEHLSKLILENDKNSIFDFLEMNNKIFNNNQVMDIWLKESSKAYIYELKSTKYPDIDVSLYTKLKNKINANKYILPLLNLTEDNVYVISTIATMYFGGYGRTIDEAIWNNKEEYSTELEKAKNKIRVSAEKFMRFLELMYTIANDQGKEEMKNNITEIFEGYWLLSSQSGEPIYNDADEKRRWATAHDQTYTAINDFFGPIGKYYSQSARKESAYANQNTKVIRFDSVNLLDPEGASTITHELTHVYDRKTWLQGNEYRPGQGPEGYALGLFQSVSTANAYFYGFNLTEELSGDVTTNNNISRFTNKEDFKTYMHNLFDVTYLVDALEAEIMLSKNNDEKSKFYGKLELTKDKENERNNRNFYRPADQHKNIKSDVDKGYIHGIDKYNELTANEIASLHTLDDLIDKNVIFKGNKFNLQNANNFSGQRNNDYNYYWISMFDPIFAGYQNDTGVAGGLIFRRNAFELLAEYGWDDGLVKYASNVLEKNAIENQILSDAYVYNQIFGNKYNTYADFRKAMYRERLAKKDNFKQITIKYKNKSYTLNNSNDIKKILTIAINDDLNNIKLNPKWSFFNREEVKKEILKKFNTLTNNFRTSIFK
ncbi:ZmpA/ZmpB/ZmpC family metallo-endopeptidase [Mycoplasma sp. CSL7503-lung]|uniref:ZmpA/ZmpB/ZmpC family metallo-endopeptidase n=1 Tax=Mycoplasma sp. CSL7503-lung TaxID=536372 RepID=UPI0021D16621|nr:ZmpA/ZmpB/ZmpC family metallo-endopeptidase [Mycoplasma sp. CSL7503-lung]MCU4706662.1 hypothetical protein [Mycoplasma sp. CSL7503-lung]